MFNAQILEHFIHTDYFCPDYLQLCVKHISLSSQAGDTFGMQLVDLLTLINPIYPQDLNSNSPYCLSYNSHNLALENLVLDQPIIP